MKKNLFLKKKKVNQREVKTSTNTNYWAQGTAVRAGLQEMRFQTDNAESIQECWEGSTCPAAGIGIQSVGQAIW